MEVEWKAEYNVGNFEIDSQHRVFVDIIRKIRDAFREGRSNDFIERFVEELHKYAEFHFCSEENRMMIFDYPEIDSHKLEHDKLIFELNNLLTHFESEVRTPETLIDFLIRWFRDHTISSDKKLSNYIRNA